MRWWHRTIEELLIVDARQCPTGVRGTPRRSWSRRILACTSCGSRALVTGGAVTSVSLGEVRYPGLVDRCIGGGVD